MAMESSEYKTLVHLGANLQLALQDSLTRISTVLSSKSLITTNQSSDLRNEYHSKAKRAADVVDWIKTKVLQDVDCFYTFIHALEDDDSQYYSHILRKLKETLRECERGNNYYICT